MENCWLCIDESGNETIHQSEPHYNRIQCKWKSLCYIYVKRGFAGILLPQNYIEMVSDEKVISCAFEITSITNGKAQIREFLKIFK